METVEKRYTPSSMVLQKISEDILRVSKYFSKGEKKMQEMMEKNASNLPESHQIRY